MLGAQSTHIKANRGTGPQSKEGRSPARLHPEAVSEIDAKSAAGKDPMGGCHPLQSETRSVCQAVQSINNQ